MDWLLPFIIGWCGGVIIVIYKPFPWPPPGPDNCIVCGGLLGGIGAIILEQILRPSIVDIGFGDRFLFDLAAGFATASLVRGIVSFTSKRQANR